MDFFPTSFLIALTISFGSVTANSCVCLTGGCDQRSCNKGALCPLGRCNQDGLDSPHCALGRCSQNNTTRAFYVVIICSQRAHLRISTLDSLCLTHLSFVSLLFYLCSGGVGFCEQKNATRSPSMAVDFAANPGLAVESYPVLELPRARILRGRFEPSIGWRSQKTRS